MIAIKLGIVDFKEFQRGNLPPNAVRIDSEDPTKEIVPGIVALEVGMVAVVIVSMFMKAFVNHTFPANPFAIVGGIIVGFLLLAAHEWLHAIVYPKAAKVTMGTIKGKMMAVALASYPMTRIRFIIMCLLPFVLGILPLLIFILSPVNNRVLNGFAFGMAAMGMASPCADVYNVITVLRQSHKNDQIMFYEDGLFRIGE